MKISLNWVKQFTEINVSVDELVAKIGSQLGEVEEVIHLGNAYENVVIAKVKSCEKHPNADKLSVCLLDDGGKVEDVERKDGLVEVVCGAPNVKAGMSIAWIPPKATVPQTYFDEEPFVLSARELRGVVSNGMIASAKELGIGDEHNGILEITEEAQPGDSFAELFDLKDEVIIDIENKMFTHRPDCFGLLGVAREIAGILGNQFTSPDDYAKQIEGSWDIQGSELPLTVTNTLLELVPRFMAVAMSDVEIKPSNFLTQTYLARVGLKPVNNIVDVTNYYMYLTGQPMHAFDYDKVAKASGGEAVIEVRHPKPNEEILLLNGKIIKPRAEAIMIATPNQLIGVGGVMGGADTEVDDDTKNIILECATFDMYSIRRTSMEHGLFTDAVTRYSKGQSPWQNDRVLNMTIEAISKEASGSIASKVIDNKADLSQNPEIEVSVDFINSRLGSNLEVDHVKKMLEAVEFSVHTEDSMMKFTAPFWRTDIHIPEDIVEEVGRLYGYDNLPKELPTRTTKPQKRSELFSFKKRLREALAKAGANEVLTYSFVHKNLLEIVGQDPDQAYTLNNALSPDLQKYRLSLTPSLLTHVHQNIKAGHKEFALFEIAKTHNKNHLVEGDLPLEIETLALTYANQKPASSGAAFYAAKAYLNTLADRLGLQFEYKSIKKDPELSITAPFDLRRSAVVMIVGSDNWIGMVGEYKNSVTKKLKLPEHSAGFEISVLDILKAADSIPAYKPLSKFPSTELDVTLKVANSISFGQLKSQIATKQTEIAQAHKIGIAITATEAYQQDDSQTVNYTFKITITPYEATLTTDQSVAIKDQLLESLELKFEEV
ncbi:TPA: phenylalanine--tRNA ligase subunit beta [Candidatus Saccharibacteria bacterium]|nr:phenylalanine--tRNA ligase subunit beta [Candidatus Saccharibacteria bacterium]HIO87641.1 phenylalanine--tRNA ligase subunit beta [Candidatus Saccharibacteria bacterium]